MRRRNALLILGTLLISVQAGGCALWKATGNFTRETARAFKPTGTDYRDGSTPEELDEWSSVGAEARGDQPYELDPDPWWQRHFMSQDARNIERNLGIR